MDGRLLNANARLIEEELASQVHYRLVEGLVASERHYRELIETLSVPVFETEGHGQLCFVNDAWSTQLGYSKSESLGRNIGELIDPDDRERTLACLRPAPENLGAGSATDNVRVRKADGTMLVMNLTAVGMRQGRVSGVFHDVTAQYQTQLALQRALDYAEAASQAKSRFLAHMSHEIRTPIGVIMGACESLSEDDLTASDREQLLQRMRANGSHVLTLIGDILDVARIEAGHLEVTLAPCDLNDLLTDVLAVLQQQVGDRRITVRTNRVGSMPAFIQTDPTRLRQILLNLGGNALKFTTEGSVVIETEVIGEGDENQVLVLRVRDTGIGIEPTTIARLFEPFQQADTSYSRRFEGAGLGLSIARGLARRLGGDIHAASEVGIGSVFSVHLPRGASAPWSFAEAERRMPDGTSARILLAEDNADLQVLTQRVVAKMGLRIDVVADGQSALDAVARMEGNGSYSLILMDMQMPGLDGYAATEELRRRGYRGPVVALTAHAMKGDRERCLAAGCDDYVAKPISRKDLRALIDRYVARNGLAGEASPAQEVSWA